MQRKAIILFSGGLDSTTCLALAKEQEFSCYALSFHFGQKHHVELTHAAIIAKKLGVVDHKILSIELNKLGGSSLTDKNREVPDYQGGDSIPSTYVPARNTIFLSLALSWAEVVDASDIFYGANFIDYSGYPDCRPDYIEAFQQLANLATAAGRNGKHFHIHAPLLKMSKSDIIREGMRLGIDYGETVSCYRADSQGRACGQCDSCTYRKRGFEQAGVIDPTRYVTQM